MPTAPLSPDEELALVRAKRRRTRLTWAAVTFVAAASIAFVWWTRRPQPERPERGLFAKALPTWSIERLNGNNGELQRLRMLQQSEPWPGVRAGLEKLATVYGNRDAFKGAVAELNQAAQGAGLPFWVDGPFYGGKQWVTTYDLLGRVDWALASGERSVEVLRVRRLDKVNFEMAFLGHAGGDRPVVLADRVESELLDHVLRTYSKDEFAGDVEQAARGAWRHAMQAIGGAEALAEAAKLLQERGERVERLQKGFTKGLHIEFPERIALGDDFLDGLEQYADPRRPGGPLLLRQALVAVREADRALRQGPARKALDAVLDRMMQDTEAHEARHIFEPFPSGSKVPELLVEVIGDADDVRFNESAARELLAYMGQLHAASEPCTVLSQLAFRAAGDRARATPHHYASWLLLEQVGSAPDQPLDEERLAGDVIELCHASAGTLRTKVEAAHQRLFGTPFVPATRAAPQLAAAKE